MRWALPHLYSLGVYKFLPIIYICMYVQFTVHSLYMNVFYHATEGHNRILVLYFCYFLRLGWGGGGREGVTNHEGIFISS
jgi:hypothetical protein